MKKNVIAVILSIVLSAGHMGAVPALAAESAGDGQTIVEAADAEAADETENETAEKTENGAAEETGKEAADETENGTADETENEDVEAEQEAQSDPVEAAEDNEDDTTASGDTAQEGEEDITVMPEDETVEDEASSDEDGVNEEKDEGAEEKTQEDGDDASSGETSAEEETAADGSSDENDILTVDEDDEKTEIVEEQDQEEASAEEQKKGILLNGGNARIDLDISFESPRTLLSDDLWFRYSELRNECESAYDDYYYYWDSDYKSVFSDEPVFKLACYDGGALKELGDGDTGFANVTKTYYVIVKYPVKSGVTIDRGSTIKVNGQAVNWSCSGGYLQFMLTAYQGGTPALSLYDSSHAKVHAGDRFTLSTDSYRGEIAAARTSNAAVLQISYTSNQVSLLALKPGTASITVTGKNGLSCTLNYTVGSFIKTSSVTINSGKGKYIYFADDFANADDYKYSISNKKVVSISKDYDRFKVVGKYPGKATITLKGKYNEISTVTVVVKPALSSTTKTPKVIYGATSITSKTTPGAKVTAKIGKKTYKATAAASGKYTIKIPVVKIGTKIKMKFTSARTSLTKTITVKKCASNIETTEWVYRDSTRVKGKAVKVHKGDYIKIKINGRTYKKKISKNANSFKFSINIQKPNDYGIRMTTELYNKYNQRLAIEKEYVYKSNYVYVGDSKSTVRWLTSWNDPNKKNYYSTGEQWCYDWDGDGLHDAYLYFRDDRVIDWYISE